MNTVMNLWVQQNEGNFLTSCGTISFSRKILPQGVGYTEIIEYIVYEIINMLTQDIRNIYSR
jgi:hypothetical protein